MTPYPYAAYPVPFMMYRPGYVLPFAYPVWAIQFDEKLAEHTKEGFNEAEGKCGSCTRCGTRAYAIARKTCQ